MRVILLHMSDIHIREGSNAIATRLPSIARALNICIEEECVCFLIVSGDIANSGNSTEYEIAHKCISELIRELESNTRISEVHPVLVPGNHDCNFANVRSTRFALIDRLRHVDKPYTSIDNDYISDLTRIQEDYFTFAQNLDGVNQKASPLYWLRKFEIQPYHVYFVCLNTAWISEKTEEPGKLIFPSPLVHLDEIRSDKNTLTISVFHHPFGWFDPRYVKEYRDLILGNSDVVVTGHDHDIDMRTVISVKGKISEIMEGGLLQCDDKVDSSFNIEMIDLERRLQKKYLLVWHESEHYYEPEKETEWLPFLSLQTHGTFRLKTLFKRFLARLDVQITNPKSGRLLEVDDVYVNPSLDINYAKRGIISTFPTTVRNLDDLLKVAKEYRKILIVGNKFLGKTVLLKKLFSLMLDQDLVPLYCGSRQFSQFRKRTESAVKQLFERQYENDGDVAYQKYRQLPISERAILVDDLDKAQLNLHKIEAVLEAMHKYFGIVIVASGPMINVKEIFDDPSALIDYTRMTVNDYGLPVIHDIVEKWTRLALPESTEIEVQYRIKVVENTLFNTMSREAIPRNPFFILTILHRLDNEQSPEAQPGSYGYYFQTIINVMVAKVAKNPNLVGQIHDYFSNLAFHMLENKTGKINRDELDEINRRYLERTGFSFDLDQVINNSIDEEVLVYEQNSYFFAANYYFEFFAAKYISDHLRDQKLQHHMLQIIDRISLHIHKEVYSNIMMFLSFHSKDPVILQAINQKAQQIFTDLAKFDIHKDVEFLNRLSPQTRVHHLAEKDVKETKRELLEASDAATEIADIQYGLVQDVNSLEELSVVGKMLYAFSLVKVLGQIIKRYLSGDLEERIALTKECYDLGLKTIKHVFNEIKSEMGSTQEELARAILERNPSISNDKLSAATADWIWTLCESICMISIKNISHNVGAPELGKVYKLILERYPEVAYEFIDISIKMDHFEALPEEKIIDLAERLKEAKNYFCRDLLSLLFIYHVYQFYTPIRQIQRVASALELTHLVSEPNVFLPTKKMLPRP